MIAPLGSVVASPFECSSISERAPPPVVPAAWMPKPRIVFPAAMVRVFRASGAAWEGELKESGRAVGVGLEQAMAIRVVSARAAIALKDSISDPHPPPGPS